LLTPGSFDNDDDENFDQPLIANLNFSSTTSAETVSEIENSRLKARPLIKVQFTKKRKEFNQAYKFNEIDANEKMQDVKQQNDPFMHQKNRVLDMGFQGGAPQTSSGSQTTWNRKINKTFQTTKTELPVQLEDDNPDLLKFLESVSLPMEEALQSNEILDIFHDDFQLFSQNQASADGNELSNVIKEQKSFFYMNTRGKKISCI